MGDYLARNVTRVTVSHVLVRACVRCGGKREQGEPCASCGNPDPPVTHDLGVQAYSHRNPLKRWAWHLAGAPLAARRARAASRDITG